MASGIWGKNNFLIKKLIFLATKTPKNENTPLWKKNMFFQQVQWSNFEIFSQFVCGTNPWQVLEATSFFLIFKVNEALQPTVLGRQASKKKKNTKFLFLNVTRL